MEQLSNEELLEAKNRIMNGDSITSISKEIKIDRKTLKKHILEVLDSDKKEEFENKLKSNCRKNRVSVRKQKRLNGEEQYKQAIEELVNKGINKTDIEIIYSNMSKNPHVKMSKDTFVLKLLDLLEFCKERNQGITEGSRGYITKEDLIKMIIKDNKIMTSDINKKIKPVCKIIDSQENITQEDTNEIIKNTPHIFRNSVKKIKIFSIISENFLVRDGIRYVDLFRYTLESNPYMLNMNIEKLFKRLCHLKDINKSTILTKVDLNDISRSNAEDYDKDTMYLLPRYDEEKTEEFRGEVKEILATNRNNVKEQ